VGHLMTRMTSAPPPTLGIPEPLLALRSVSKRYPGVQALDGVDLSLNPGSIHALVGGNGSGKSTLIKILAGVVSADSGSLRLAGDDLCLKSHTPENALRTGLRFVHQQPSVFGGLTVAENLGIVDGFGTARGRRIDWRKVEMHASAVLERFDLDADPGSRVEELPPVTQTMIAVVRALQDQDRLGHGVLVLDEPTAVLPPSDVHLVLAALQRYASMGHSILFVSHRLDEVLEIADRISVLRDGRSVTTVPRSQVDRDGLVELISGKAINGTSLGSAAAAPRIPATAAPALEVRDLKGAGVAGVSLEVKSGEVVGVAGLPRAGHQELIHHLYGLRKSTGGTVIVGGEAFVRRTPKSAIRAGLAYIPADRSHAIFADHDLSVNLSIGELGRYWRRGRLNRVDERRDARAVIDGYGVSAASERIPLGSLSGGNQQKIVLARALRRRPRVLLLDEPTQGVDISSRVSIYGLIRDAARQGACVLLASTDYEELELLSDRVLIFADGRVASELKGDQISVNSLTSLVGRSVPQ
jgi:ribose transport system ATP-binding protein